jgi:hypothetical protein
LNTYRIQTILRPIRSLVIDTAKIGIVFSLFTLISVGYPLSLVAADTNNTRPDLAQTETTEQAKAEPAQVSQENNVSRIGTQANSNTSDTKTTKQPNNMVYKNAVGFANWVDKFFGDKRGLESASYDYLRLINQLVIREGESPEFRPRVKAKVILPQMKNTTSLLFSNDRSSDNKDFASQQLEQNDINSDENNQLSAAINFQTKSSHKSKIDYRLGLDSSLDLFAFARHSKPLVDKKNLDIENSNYLFWEEENGFGIATELELNQVLSEKNLFRWKYSILRAEKSQGNEWSNRFTLVDHPKDNTWITYDLSFRGKTELNYDVEQYRLAVRYRNRTAVKWLYYEIEPEIRFIRNERYIEREMVPGIALRLEIQFENL